MAPPRIAINRVMPTRGRRLPVAGTAFVWLCALVCILGSARAGRIGAGRGPGTDARESCDTCGPAVALHGGGDLPISRAMRREQSVAMANASFCGKLKLAHPSYS